MFWDVDRDKPAVLLSRPLVGELQVNQSRCESVRQVTPCCGVMFIAWLAATVGCGGRTTSSDTAAPSLPEPQVAPAESSLTNEPSDAVAPLPRLNFSQDEKPAAKAKKETTGDSSRTVSPIPDRQEAVVAASNDGFEPQRRLGPLTLVDVDEERLAAAGLQVQRSKHLVLIHEPAVSKNVAEFGKVFDQAVDQWVDYFQADAQRFSDWQVTCFYVVDSSKFQQAGLMPPATALPRGQLPAGGWEYGNQIWLHQHPGDYYSRHQLLHEGTHAFCYFNFGNLGPPWLAEGLAEYLSVHRWENGQLEMAARVSEKEQLAYWGRVKLLQDAWHRGQTKTLTDVQNFLPADFPATESYAWSWAAVSMMSEAEPLRNAFRESLQQLNELNGMQWNDRLQESLQWDRQQLETQWEVNISEMVYGYDFRRAAIQWASDDVKEIAGDGVTFSIPADGAWHQTAFRLTAGEWQFQADGDYQILEEAGQAVFSGPDGISLDYANGARLGAVEIAINLPQGFLKSSSPLTRPIPTGRRMLLKPGESGRLFVRVSDSPAALNDNQGDVEIQVRPQTTE